ncbi:MAG: hypothetical protein ACC642_00060 [Pseudomonadales bacterium]
MSEKVESVLYQQLPNIVCNHKLLHCNSKVVYALLYTFAKFADEPRLRLTNEWIGKQCGLSYQQTTRAMTQLRTAELLQSSGSGPNRRLRVLPPTAVESDSVPDSRNDARPPLQQPADINYNEEAERTRDAIRRYKQSKGE